MNIVLHTLKTINNTIKSTGNPNFVEGNPISLNYGAIVYVMHVPYPEYNGKTYSELGLSGGHVINVFEPPELVLAMIAEEEQKIIDEIDRDLANWPNYGVQKTWNTLRK